MKKILIVLYCFLCAQQANSQTIKSISATPEFGSASSIHPEIAIIPEPVSLVKNSGHFILPEKVLIHASAGPEMKAVTDYLQ